MKEMPLKNPHRKSLITDIAGRVNLLRFEPLAGGAAVVQQVGVQPMQQVAVQPGQAVAMQAQPAGGY